MAGTVESTYRAAPLLLNLERDEKHWRVASTWCNLGLWRGGATRFGDACERLAMAVGEAAELQACATLLDVGVGYGDQTALWPTRFGVRRVVAIEPSRAHVEAARSAQVEGRLAGAGVVELHVGSSNSLPEAARSIRYDAVVCLDCAYHFRTRASFLATASSLMKPGGRFAAADIILASPRSGEQQGRRWGALWRTCARRLIALLTDIPAANLCDHGGYVASLQAAGLSSVRVERVTEHVFAPFAAHAGAQRAALRSQLTLVERFFLWSIQTLFSFIARHALFDFVIVSARRPDS
jgi:cyclopropane fatty-acyl-phospholipid synthase-like methyltransferase